MSRNRPIDAEKSATSGWSGRRRWSVCVGLLRHSLVLLQTLPKPEAFALEEQNVAAMHQPVEQGRGHAFIAKHLRPMRKVQI